MFKWFDRSSFKRDRMTWLAVFAIIVIPVYTWLFGTRYSPLDYTLSMIGNKLGYRLNFVIWGTVTGLLLTFYVVRLFVLNSFTHPRARRLLLWSLAFLILTVLIPAMEHLPILKKLHAVTAVAFGISLTLSLYLFIRHLASLNKDVSIRSLWALYLVVGGSVLLFFLFGNTGIFELFFFFSISTFLLLLNRWIRREVTPKQD